MLKVDLLTFKSYNHISYVTPNKQMFEFKAFFLSRLYLLDGYY